MVAANEAALSTLEGDGLVILDEQRVRPTQAGLAVADWLAAEIDTGL